MPLMGGLSQAAFGQEEKRRISTLASFTTAPGSAGSSPPADSESTESSQGQPAMAQLRWSTAEAGAEHLIPDLKPG